jgi:hypothetical protein
MQNGRRASHENQHAAALMHVHIEVGLEYEDGRPKTKDAYPKNS